MIAHDVHRLSPVPLLAWLLAALGFAAATPVAAQDSTAVKAPAAAPESAVPQATTVTVPGVTGPFAFEGVTIVDVTDGTLVPEQTVVVEGNRVKEIGKAGKVSIPKDAQRVDFKGKYMLPGFWDMHAHTEKVGAEAKVQGPIYKRVYPHYIANGVTGVREMAQRFDHGADSFRTWQREVMDGKRVGPRAWGPSADLTHKIQLRNDSDAIHVVDSLKAAGDAFIKYHASDGNREIFFTLMREAKKAGIPIAGHVPQSVKTVEASDSGLRSIEHVNEIRECSYTVVAYYDSEELASNCAPLAQAFIRNGTWFTPTLAVFYYLSASQEEVEGSQQFVRLLHEKGYKRLLAGSDCEPFFQRNVGLNKVCHWGFSLLQEVIALSDLGLGPLGAIQTATLSAGQYFEATDSIGTVAPNKLADLVVLDENPLTNIRNILKIRGVVANGRFYDRAALDKLDPRGIEMAKLYADGQPDLDLEPPFESDTTTAEK